MPSIGSVTAKDPSIIRRANDTTPPPRPTVIRAMAFDHLPKNSSIRWEGGGGSANVPVMRPTDPAYIELGNVEQGTYLQVLNLSKNPDAQWSNPEDLQTLRFSGRELPTRQGSVYLSPEKLKQLDIQAGDQLVIRAVDRNGNVSESTNLHLEPNGYAQSGYGLYDPSGRRVGGGAQISGLDGDGKRREFLALAVNDSRVPVLKLNRFQLEVSEATGQGTLKVQRGVEPNASITIVNSRTGEQWRGTAGWDGKVELPINVKNGDPLTMTVTDEEGRAAPQVQLVASNTEAQGFFNPDDEQFPGEIPTDVG